MVEPGIEVFSEAINMPILRMPGRKFPGVLIQGDTLSSLFAVARMIHAQAGEQGRSELADLAGEMVDELAALLQEYERVLKARNHPLPYVSPFDS